MSMTVNRSTRLELHWHTRHRPLPVRWVLPTSAHARRGLRHVPGRPPLDFCARVRTVCNDIVQRCEPLRHIRMPAVLLSFTPSRNGSKYGLQARTTPLRFHDGRLTRRHGTVEYQVQRFFVDGQEMLYVVTFCLPRFLDQSFEEKLVTIVHELYHIGPTFDGDLRRHPGRYAVHSHSKRGYDAHMATIVREYLHQHPQPELFEFLRRGYRDLWQQNNGVVGTVVPRPKLLPVEYHARAAARAWTE